MTYTSLIVSKLPRGTHEGEKFHDVPRGTREGEIFSDIPRGTREGVIMTYLVELTRW